MGKEVTNEDLVRRIQRLEEENAGLRGGENELQESLERYRAVVEDQTELICRFREGGVLTFVNEAYCRNFGKRREELVGKSFLSFIPEEDREAVLRKLGSLTPESPTATYEHRVIGSDGDILWQQWTDRALFDELGRVIEFQSVGSDITGRKLLEEELTRHRHLLEELVKERTEELEAANRELRTQHGLLNAIIEGTDDPIFAKDKETRALLVNTAYEKMLGPKVQEVLGKTNAELFPPGTAEEVTEEDRLVMKTGAIEVFEQTKIVAGVSRTYLTRKAPLQDANGTVVGVLGIARDITERKQGEEALLKTNALLTAVSRVQGAFIAYRDPRELFEELLDVLLGLTDSEYGFIGEVLYGGEGLPYLKTHAITNIAWNEDTRVFYEKEAPNGMEFHNLETLFGPVMTTGRPVIANDPIRDPRRGGLPHGHPALNAFMGLPLYYGKQLSGMVGLANRPGGYDTELNVFLGPALTACSSIIEAVRSEQHRRLSEEGLRKSEERYRGLVEDMPALVCRFRLDGTLTFVNSSYCSHFNREPEELIGRNFFSFIPEPEREDVRTHFMSLNQGRPAVTYEHQIVLPEGAVSWQEWTGRVLFGEGGDPVEFQSLGRDVTERKLAEEEQRRLEAQLQHAQKLESLGVLAGGIAHDFNNLLMGVLGNADLGLATMAPETPGRHYLQKIETAAMRAAELTNQMLAYSGKGRFLVERIQFNRVVEEMVHLLRTVISKKATLKFDFTQNLPTIEADASQIRQVVMNLITNASEAIGDTSGVIGLSTGVLDADSRYLSETYLDDELPEKEYVYLEVSDTGSGMDQETRQKIFDPFFTTKFTGRGLGLAAVLGIVRGHKGAIKVYSEPGRGTSFKVLFPRSEDTPVAREEEPKRAEAARPGTTILIVDDDESVLNVAKRMLQKSGYTVLTAVDGRRGVELYRQHAGEIDLVLLDMTMPQMGGEEAFGELRRIRSDVRVILSSGYSEQDATNRFAGKGLAGFIQKPYRSAELLVKVSEVLG